MADEKEPQPPAAGDAPPAAAAPPAPAAPPAAAPPAAAPKADPLKEPIVSRAVDRLRADLPEAILDISYSAGQAIVRVAPARLIEVMRLLRDAPELRFDYLSNVTGMHWPKNARPFEVVYHLDSMPHRHRLTVKIDLADGEEAPSVTPVWPTANWHEREAFDLFGIRFAGHPDLRRILMTDEWVGHPLRKDYPLEGNPGDHMQLREVGTAEHVYKQDRPILRGFGWKKEVEKTGVGRG